jgi:hypothetical protein
MVAVGWTWGRVGLPILSQAKTRALLLGWCDGEIPYGLSCTGGGFGQLPLFLLRRQVGHPSFRFVPSVGPNSNLDTVEIGGLAIDGAGHLYAAGIIHGSCLYVRVRPKATFVSTPRLSKPYGVGGFGYGRGWVGAPFELPLCGRRWEHIRSVRPLILCRMGTSLMCCGGHLVRGKR